MKELPQVIGNSSAAVFSAINFILDFSAFYSFFLFFGVLLHSIIKIAEKSKKEERYEEKICTWEETARLAAGSKHGLWDAGDSAESCACCRQAGFVTGVFCRLW